MVFSLVVAPVSLTKGKADFDRMKDLVGAWEGKTSEGKTIRISYQLVSGGTTVMETIDMDEHKGGMMTAYHLDGEKLMMTHYCSMGNQPRMKVTNSDSKSITFTFVDGTNMTKDDAHMHKLVITWKDANNITEQWTMRANGKDESHSLFELKKIS